MLRGTLDYLAPELWDLYTTNRQEGVFNPMKTDIYSLGIIIFELLLGKGPVQNLNKSRFLFFNTILILVINKSHLIKNWCGLMKF